jgi:hypothetical protein
VSKPFFVPTAKNKPPKTAEAVDVAARHLAYKLFEATDGMRGAWAVLGKIGERPATVARAVERGWVVTREVGLGENKFMSASLTSAGRLLARRGR